MKNRINSFVACTLVIFAFALVGLTAQAQDAKKATLENGAQPANQPGKPALAENISNQAESIIDEHGNVTISEVSNGVTTTTRVNKPTVIATEDYDTGYNAFADAFGAWLKANPNHAAFLTDEEKRFLENNDMPGLYKLQFAVAEKQSQEKN